MLCNKCYEMDRDEVFIEIMDNNKILTNKICTPCIIELSNMKCIICSKKLDEPYTKIFYDSSVKCKCCYSRIRCGMIPCISCDSFN